MKIQANGFVDHLLNVLIVLEDLSVGVAKITSGPLALAALHFLLQR